MATLESMTWIKAEMPDDLHKWVRIWALQNDLTVSEAVIELIRQARQAIEEER